jgi:hypothetical protein
MGKINWTRVILGGVVAGAIINVFEYLLNAVVLAKDWAGVKFDTHRVVRLNDVNSVRLLGQLNGQFPKASTRRVCAAEFVVLA